MRKVTSRKNMIFDEHATVHNIAETDTWIPVLQPDRSHWLDVVLIVDESPSMIIWYETISELKELLERQGAFRNVQLWGFICDEEKKTICLHEGLCFGHKPQRTRHPKELIDPTNRRLILIISDCVSNSWQDGTVSQLLKTWHSNSRVAIVQMLPHYLWKRTSLKKAENVYFQNISSATVNSKLEIETSPFGEHKTVSNSLKMPVITLEDRSILPWAKSLAGSSNVWLTGILLELLPTKKLDEKCDKKSRPVLDKTIHDKLNYFMGTASPEAQYLLRSLAALPLTLPVIMLAQRIILPNSRQVHLAEVLLSGVIKPKELIRPYPLYKELLFDFEDGIREILIKSQPIEQTINALSAYLDDQIGLPKSLRAIVADPNLFSISSKNNLLAPLVPFAQIDTRILRFLGGKYIDVAERIELKAKNFSQETKPVEQNENNISVDHNKPQMVKKKLNNNSKKKDKYNQILDAAVSVFADQGFQNSTISQIAREAGVADGTIYLYFKNKQDIFSHFFTYKCRLIFNNFKQTVDKEKNATDKLRTLIRIHFQEFQRDRKMAQVFRMGTRQNHRLMETHIKEMAKMYLNLIESIVEQGQVESTMRQDLFISLVKRFILGAVEEIINVWVISGGKYDLVSQADPLVDLFLKGIGEDGLNKSREK